MEMSGEDYKALVEEKFKNLHETVERNRKDQREDREEDHVARKKDTEMVLGKIGEVLDVVSGLKKDQSHMDNKIQKLSDETSVWRLIQGAFKKKPAISMSVVLGIWYILSLAKVKEFLFSFIDK